MPIQVVAVQDSAKNCFVIGKTMELAETAAEL